MSERKPGYYMVRYNHDGSPWEPAEWDGERWMLIGNGGSFSPSAIGEVGPRIPTPDEPWVTVPVQPDEAMIDAAFWAWGSTDVRSIYIDMISSAPKPEDT